MPFIFVIIIALYSWGAEANPSATSQEWKKQMVKKLPSTLCEKNHYFKQCFKISKKTCSLQSKKLTVRCLRAGSFPNPIDLTKEGITLSNQIGRCVGEGLERLFKNKKHQKKKCYEAHHWM